MRQYDRDEPAPVMARAPLSTTTVSESDRVIIQARDDYRHYVFHSLLVIPDHVNLAAIAE